MESFVSPTQTSLDYYAKFLVYLEKNLTKQDCELLTIDRRNPSKLWKAFLSNRVTYAPDGARFLNAVDSIYVSLFLNWYQQKTKTNCPPEDMVPANDQFFFKTLSISLNEQLLTAVFGELHTQYWNLYAGDRCDSSIYLWWLELEDEYKKRMMNYLASLIDQIDTKVQPIFFTLKPDKESDCVYVKPPDQEDDEDDEGVVECQTQ